MLSRPGEFNPNNYGISLLPAMMSDYAKKKKKKKKLVVVKATQLVVMRRSRVRRSRFSRPLPVTAPAALVGHLILGKRRPLWVAVAAE
jgi:hypothetical protein